MIAARQVRAQPHRTIIKPVQRHPNEGIRAFDVARHGRVLAAADLDARRGPNHPGERSCELFHPRERRVMMSRSTNRSIRGIPRTRYLKRALPPTS